MPESVHNTIPRRHDLDAFRAMAMLSGIVLHAALSFSPIAWFVQDGEQHEAFGWLVGALHGFRMPLFFLISGFFTAMLWRNRGLKSLLWNRYRRVARPLFLGMITVVPLTTSISSFAVLSGLRQAGTLRNATGVDDGFWGGAWKEDVNVIIHHITNGANLRLRDSSPGQTPQSLAAPQDQRSDSEDKGSAALLLMLQRTPFLNHLWFLWFLCWLVSGFAICAAIVDRLKLKGTASWLLSPTSLLWLIPLTMIPQWYMGRETPSFGPDTSAGFIPIPSVMLYFAIFFGFGALYYDADDKARRLGRLWWLMLPTALLVVFPLGMALTYGDLAENSVLVPSVPKLAADALKASYAWLMSFGCMGLFRRLLNRKSGTMRYLSDSSYWLYLGHLPLIIWLQLVVRDWPLPTVVKFALICSVCFGLMLLSYQWFVRYTLIGTLLNGRRTRKDETRRAGPLDV